MNNRTILSLCDLTGNWSQPYADAGYQVIRVDLENGQDVRLLRHLPEPIHGILAAPPCTHFSKAGAWMWKQKGPTAILEGMAIVDACLRMVAIYHPQWWALENPVGRLRDFLGPPKWSFDPCDFGDPYTKKTLLWGNFTPPMPLFSAQARNVVNPQWHGPTPGSRDLTTAMGSRGRKERSATPPGFAQAWFEANP